MEQTMNAVDDLSFFEFNIEYVDWSNYLRNNSKNHTIFLIHSEISQKLMTVMRDYRNLMKVGMQKLFMLLMKSECQVKE